jgi:ABC-2 type transport system permease protein
MRKGLNDALAVAWLEWLRVRGYFWVFVPILLLWPLTMLFVMSHVLPADATLTPRLIAGSIVFAVGLNAVNNTGQTLVFWRFSNRLKLLVASPMHQASFVGGFLVVPVGHGLFVSSVLLALAPLYGISIHISLWFWPVVAITALSMVGLALLIGTWSPSQAVGNQLSQISGVLVVLVSPIYYPVSRLPDWLQPVAQFSPYTHAANALDGILSGRGDFYGEIGILALITAAGLVLGLRGMRWREA